MASDPKKSGQKPSRERRARTSSKPSKPSELLSAGNLPVGPGGSATSSSFSAEEHRKFLLALVHRLSQNEEPYRLAKLVLLDGKGGDAESEIVAIMDDWNTAEGPAILVYKYLPWEKTTLPSYNQMTWVNISREIQVTRIIGFKWLDDAEVDSFLFIEQFEDYN